MHRGGNTQYLTNSILEIPLENKIVDLFLLKITSPTLSECMQQMQSIVQDLLNKRETIQWGNIKIKNGVKFKLHP